MTTVGIEWAVLGRSTSEVAQKPPNFWLGLFTVEI